MNLEQTKKIGQTFGARAALHDLFCRAANHGAEMMVLKGIVMAPHDLACSWLEQDGRPGWGFLDRETLIAVVLSQPSEMTLEFVRKALCRGDRCYGLIQDGQLASYGWYSTRPTAVTADLMLHFDPQYVYMYKGFTLPRYRGMRLHGIGMGRALAALHAEGKRGLISYVNSNNFASLKSCYRLGYKDFGRIFVLKMRNRTFIHATKGCKRYDFRIEQTGSTGGDDESKARMAAGA